MSAIKKSFKLPKQAYGLYRSASMHVKQKMSVPMMAYLIPIIILFVGYMGHKSYNAVMNRAKPDTETIVQEEMKPDETKTATIQTQPAQHPVPSPVSIPHTVPVAHPLVSDRVDWEKISACLATKEKCICYGHNAERLVIPPDTCRLAVKHGWPGKNVVITTTNL